MKVPDTGRALNPHKTRKLTRRRVAQISADRLQTQEEPVHPKTFRSKTKSLLEKLNSCSRKWFRNRTSGSQIFCHIISTEHACFTISFYVNAERELTLAVILPAMTCSRATLCNLPVHPQGDEIIHVDLRQWLSCQDWNVLMVFSSMSGFTQHYSTSVQLFKWR